MTTPWSPPESPTDDLKLNKILEAYNEAPSHEKIEFKNLAMLMISCRIKNLAQRYDFYQALLKLHCLEAAMDFLQHVAKTSSHDPADLAETLQVNYDAMWTERQKQHRVLKNMLSVFTTLDKGTEP
jgi:hypothetical protein